MSMRRVWGSALGQHNLQILRDVAKLSEAEIQELTEAGVIATSPRETAPPAPGAAWFQARNSETLYDPKYQEHIRPLVDAATPEHDA